MAVEQRGPDRRRSPRPDRAGARRLATALGAWLLALGCGSQSVNGTLVVVEVKSDLAIPAQLDALEIAVRTAAGSATRRFSVGAGTLPVQLGVVPEGKTSGDFTVTVTAFAAGKEILSQKASAAFVPNEARKLELFLSASCLPVAPGCSGDQTCRAGTCVMPGAGVMLLPYLRDAGTGPVFEGGPVTPDAWLEDASVPDAPGTDATPLPADTAPEPDLPPGTCGRLGGPCCGMAPLCNGAATCEAAMCQCLAPAVTCGAFCVFPGTNPNHCGSCNRSCQGGACVSGNCAPVMVAGAQDNPTSLEVDDTNLYWRRGPASAGAIAGLPKNGSGSIVDLVTMLDGQGALASNGNRLVYFANRNMWSCALPACAAPLRLGPTAPTMSLGIDIIDAHLNVPGNRVFWTDHAKLYSVPVQGGPTMTHLTGNFSSVAMALDTQHMYYVERDAMSMLSVSKLTINPPPARGPVVELAAGSGLPRELAVTANRLLWITTNALGSIALDTPVRAPPPPLATGSITRMAVEGSTVFWGEFMSATSGRVLSCSTTGCRGVSPVVVATTCGPTYLAADATTVYWICGNGTIWKVAR